MWTPTCKYAGTYTAIYVGIICTVFILYRDYLVCTWTTVVECFVDNIHLSSQERAKISSDLATPTVPWGFFLAVTSFGIPLLFD